MAEITEAWKCSYCNMTSMSKSSVLRHERKSCSRHRACGVCRFFVETTETVYNPNHGGDPGSTDYEMQVWWCDSTDAEIPHKVCNCEKFEPRASQ